MVPHGDGVLGPTDCLKHVSITAVTQHTRITTKGKLLQDVKGEISEPSCDVDRALVVVPIDNPEEFGNCCRHAWIVFIKYFRRKALRPNLTAASVIGFVAS